MKKNLKFKISFLVSLSVILIAIVTSMVYAFISTTSTRGEIEVSAATITAETTYTSSTNSFAWTYEEAGDTKQINITTSNQAGVILHRFYNIELASGFTSNENLLKAIIVYYNDEYVGVLNDIINSNPDIQEEYNFIGLSSNKTDNFKFELHQAAINSIFDNKDIKITITTYTENADYYRYIFVHNEAEFSKAVDDVNSGLFTEIPSIVLCNNVTLENSYTISDSVKLYLNGSTLNGSLTINDTTSTNPDALLEVLGTGTFNVTVTLGSNYDTAGAVTLVKNHIKEVLASGLAAGSTTDILGYYSFYGVSIAAVTRCTYTTPNVIIANTANEYYNALGSVRVNNDENISFKILGTKTALLDETLAYMPEDGATITSDLFLPTYIPSQNANITWTSSDESIITSTGMITADRLENAEVTLYAEIKVNETIITRRYNFKVSAHNNEINFYKLVQEISPIVINNVRNSDSDDDDALYYLPIVSQNNDGTFNTYDYRTSYKSPVNTEMFDWKAFKDIGLENITYSMELDTNDNIKYDYITLTNGNELYLNTITLNNFARIVVTGDFGNHETYTTYVNISISVGSNTQLLEKAFTQVSEELANISVLGNILSTRIESGMKNEKGDFSLSHAYTDTTTNTVNEDYTIEYSGAEDIIDSITYNSTTDKYDFTINPEYFNEYETTVAFTATVYYLKGEAGQTSKSRTFYVTVPAALHVSDFGTISIYNSTKYQVFNQLPSNEKTHTTGYTVSSSTLTDSNLDYILLRDIVGDANYLAQYNNNNTKYLDMNNITSSNYAKGTETLSYQTAESNPTSTTDTQAYDFARLIEWATGNTRATAASVVSNTSALMSGNTNLGNTKANAEDYLNNDEIAVLKQYYISCTGATETQWNSLFSEVFNVAPGYIYTNPALLNKVIECISNQITGSNYYSGYDENYWGRTYKYTSFSTIFGKYMEILQRYAVSTTKVNANDVAPCQEQYNTRYVWTHTSTNDTTIGISNNAINVNGTGYTASFSVQLADGTWWQRFNYAGETAGDGGLAGIYARPAYAADRTSYITEAELTVLRVFLLNAITKQQTSPYTTYIANSFSTTNLDAIEAVINNNQDYYSNYRRSDFNTLAKAILNAFDACLEIPTYFATDGVAKIIKSFYNRKDYKLPSYDGTVTTSFVSSLNGNIPYITNADNIKSVLSYFVNLKTLAFNGNSNLAVFLSENGLSTVFARTGLYNKEITSLTMEHVAHSSVNFDLTNIKNFTKLTTLDLSNNSGIKSVNELVNVNRGQYTLVNIEQIGVEYEYQAFAIDNIATPDCTVRYTDAVGTNTYSKDSSRASDLADLSDFNKFITKYMYMTNVIYNDDGSTTTVTWRIDEGNEIYSSILADGGNYPSISTFDEMNQLISPYYYANATFTYMGIEFEAGKLYKVTYDGSKLVAALIGSYSSISDLSNSDFNIDTTVGDHSSYTPTTEVISSKNVEVTGTVSYSNKTDWFTGTTYETDVISEVELTYNVYTRPDANNRATSVALPTKATIETYISNQLSQQGYIVNDYEYTIEIIVTSWNYNSSTSFDDSWQHGLLYGSTVLDYSPRLVGGQQTYQFKSITSTMYLNKTLYIRYNNNKGSNGNVYYYPAQEPAWTNNNRQCFDSVVINLHCTVDHRSNVPSKIEITYNDNTTQTYSGYYAAGYVIKKSEGTTILYTETEKTIFDYENGDSTYTFYAGPNTLVLDENGNSVNIKHNSVLYVHARFIYPVNTRSRTYRIVGDVYTADFWYIRDSWLYNNFNNGFNSWFTLPDSLNVDGAGIIDGETIKTVSVNDVLYDFSTYFTSILPSNSTTRTNVSGFDVDWNTVPLTSTWVFDKLYFNSYLNYVSNINSNSHSLLDKQNEIYTNMSSFEFVYKYSGTTTTDGIYVLSMISNSVTYNQNYGYILGVSNGQLIWTYYSTSLVEPSGDTLDSILAEANSHFADYRYGEYYGKYCAYNGIKFYSSGGNYYENGYVYRIMPNSSNTAFEWVKVCAYTSNTADNILQSLGTGGLEVGSYCYATSGASFGFFDGSQWYKVVLDEKTNIVNLVKFNDLGFATNGATTYTQLTNDKLVPKSIGDGQDYLGYSGTFTVQISAMIRTYNSTTGTWTEYIKTYKLKFVGSLTS